ncbi:MAG: fused MFS/spermidine synthase, partial [SAR202 cluster bacterium]|nr:fused MFS/spermidine synthase [SAR202 cluster bacterium]
MIEGPPEGDWHYELITPGLLQTEQRLQVFYRGQTEYQHVEVMDGATFGRTLVLDGKTQSTEVDEFAYHEALVHPSMIAHPNPKSVFVAGGGEGATIREVMSHKSVEQVVMVDIDKQVVDLCREYLPNHHQGSFDDPRLELHHMDALKFLEDTKLRFDVVIIDVPDPLEAGPAVFLFTQEFYTLLKDRLNPDGLMVAQSGPTGPAFYEQCFSAVANTVGSV